MKFGIVGLGRMGLAIAKRLIAANIILVGYDPDENSMQQAINAGVIAAPTLQSLAQSVDSIWLMVPIDKVDRIIENLLPHLRPKTIIVDGGNSFYQDSMRRAQFLAEHSIDFLDCGTSGGVHGQEYGFCLMVGGEIETYKKVEPFLEKIAAPHGYAYMGRSGTGHYVKMVHNGIEYGLLQAYAEGFELLKQGSFASELDLEKISGVWQEGSVIRSWLLSLAHNVFKEDQEFKNISGYVAEGGTGKWTMDEAEKYRIAMPVLHASLEQRRLSRIDGGTYATKLIALLRNQFGKHAVRKIDDTKD